MNSYPEFDFEESFKRQIENLEEWEITKILREKKLGMVYVCQTTKAGDQLELDVYPTFGGRHDLPRGKREKKTCAAQRSLNERRAKRKLAALIHANFTKGDLWCTWTYDEEHLPESIEEAKRMFGNFIKRVNRWRKARGLAKTKYIVVTEWKEDPKKGIRCHHHAIMSGDNDRDVLESLWRYGSRNHTRRLEPDENGLYGVAEYIAKDPKGQKRWSSSRGLKKPTVTRALGKFSKRRVERMAIYHDYLKEQIEKKNPNYEFASAEVRVNELNGGFYIYARMNRKRYT